MRRKTGGSYRKTRGNSVSTSGGRAFRPGAALIQQVFNKENNGYVYRILSVIILICVIVFKSIVIIIIVIIPAS